MVAIVMRKRKARWPGEVGLFAENEIAADDFAHVKMDAEVRAVVTTPRSLAQLKWAWAFAQKIADACDWLNSKEQAMDFMLIEAGHFDRIRDPIRNFTIIRPKPTNFGSMDGAAYTSLLNKMVHVAVSFIVPGLDENMLKREIEAMVGPEPTSNDRRGGDAGTGLQPGMRRVLGESRRP